MAHSARIEFHSQVLAQLEARALSLRATHCDAQIALRNAQSFYESTSEDLNDVESRISSLRKTIRDLKAHFPARLMQKFPDELLRMVFAEVAADMRAQATWAPDEQWVYVAPLMSFRLASVCRHWRHVALDTTALWTLVTFRMETPENATKILRRMKLLISRGKQSPIDISSTWRSFNWSIDSSTDDVPRLLRVLQAAAPRWRRVFLIAPDFMDDSFVCQFRFPTPLLEELSITLEDSVHDQELYASCLPHCPRLKRLRIHNGRVLPSRDIKPFPPLEYLSLICDLPSLVIWQVIALAPNLVRLELTLSERKENIHQPQSAITLQSLRHLACIEYADVLFHAWIDRLRLPQLSSLEVIRPDTTLLHDWLPRLEDTVTSFKYRSDIVLGEALASTIAALPKLRTLVLEAPCDAGLFQSFSTHASLPALETLTLSYDWAAFTELDIVEALLAFVRHRNDLSASGGGQGTTRLKSVGFDEPDSMPDWLNEQLNFLTFGPGST